jgi:hypothetical protein
MKTKITNYIRAGYPALYLITSEEVRAEAEIKGVADDLSFALHFWSTTDGLVQTSTGAVTNALDPMECLQAIADLKEKTIVILRDFHLFLTDPNPILIRKIKDTLKECKTANKTLILLGCRLVLPPELEREITVVD